MEIKKYKLIDLVSRGSRARSKVDSDLLIGESSNGYRYGDILDANATAQLISDSVGGVISGIDGTLSEELQDLKSKDEAYEERLRIIEEIQELSKAKVSDDVLVIS